jgi:hypothetical protein
MYNPQSEGGKGVYSEAYGVVYLVVLLESTSIDEYDQHQVPIRDAIAAM